MIPVRFKTRRPEVEAFKKLSLFGFDTHRTFFDFGGGGDDERPTFSYTPISDPYVEKTQSFAFPYYTNMLEGKINDYYAPIGEFGGESFQDMLNTITKTTSNKVAENLSRRGMQRSGLSGAMTAKGVADAAATLGWDDYLRAMEERKYLLAAGSQGLSGVRSAALTNQNQMNNYAFNAAKLNYLDDLEQYEQEDEMSDFWNKIIKSGLSTAGTIAGAYIGGPYGAIYGSAAGNATGKMLGSAKPDKDNNLLWEMD